MTRRRKKRRDKRKKKKDGNIEYLGSAKKRQPQKDKGVSADDITWEPAGSKGVGKLTRAIDDGLCLVDGCTDKADPASPLGGLCTDHWLTEKQEGLLKSEVKTSQISSDTVVSTKIRSKGFLWWWRRWFS